MRNDFLLSIIDGCLQAGCSFVEIVHSKNLNFRIGFEDDNSIHDFLDVSFISIVAIYNEKFSKVFMTYDEGLSLNFVIELVIKNAIQNKPIVDFIREATRETLIYEDVNDYNFLKNNIKSDSYKYYIDEWLDKQCGLVNSYFNCSTQLMVYSVEFVEMNLLNSFGQKGKYVSRISQLNGICKIRNDPRENAKIFYNLNNVEPPEQVWLKLKDENFDERIWYQISSTNNIQPLKGKIKLSYQACSQIITSLVQFFNAEMIKQNFSFLKTEHIGCLMFGPNVNLLDIPNKNKSSEQKYFDCEGITKDPKFLIQNGIVTGFLGNIDSKIRTCICTPGNAGRKSPHYEIVGIYPDYSVLELTGEVVNDYDSFLGELGFESMLDPKTGMLMGMAFGYIKHGTEKKPCIFNLNLSVFDIFKDVLPASEAKWVGKVYTPEIIFNHNT